jgi:thiol-disulfide isomerase/thioredoxin
MPKLPSIIKKLPKTLKKIPKAQLRAKRSCTSKKSMDTIGNILNYVMVLILLALIVYTIMYIYNIHKHTTETFSQIDDSNKMKDGKLHVIYIYSDSCGFCKKFTPEFNNFNEQVKSSSLQNIGSVSKYSIEDPSVDMYKSSIQAFPTVLIVDNKGKIKESFIGYRKGTELYTDVKKVSMH